MLNLLREGTIGLWVLQSMIVKREWSLCEEESLVQRDGAVAECRDAAVHTGLVCRRRETTNQRQQSLVIHAFHTIEVK